jgi:hypothetical protein
MVDAFNLILRGWRHHWLQLVRLDLSGMAQTTQARPMGLARTSLVSRGLDATGYTLELHSEKLLKLLDRAVASLGNLTYMTCGLALDRDGGMMPNWSLENVAPSAAACSRGTWRARHS